MLSLSWPLKATLAALLLGCMSPASTQSTNASDHHAALVERSQLVRRAWTGHDLRILPVGDSITVGLMGSTDGNGYRLFLRNKIKRAGNNGVDFIGSSSTGDANDDNQHEGFGGYRISAIQQSMKDDKILLQRPNLVLLHAGTNDNNGQPNGELYSDTPKRLAKLLDMILCECPDAVVLVAQIIQNDWVDGDGLIHQAVTDTYNYALLDVVADRYSKGYKVRAVDMTHIGDSLLSDILHPNGAGYEAMADAWFDSIANVPEDWWSPLRQASSGRSGGTLETCAQGSTAFLPAVGGGKVAAGAHVQGDSGEPMSNTVNTKTFIPGWLEQGMVAMGTGYKGSGVVFADLDGSSGGMRDDYFWVDSESGAVRAWLNQGDRYWKPVFGGNIIVWGTGNGAGARFADLTGDGRDDYIVLSDTGSMRVFKNAGPNGDVWLWSELTDVNKNWAPSGLTTTSVIFGDVNGDGKADMAIAKSDGTLDFYLAQGDIGTSSFSWLKCANKGFWLGNPHINLVDLDGDGKADFLSMDNDGGIKGYLSNYGGGCDIRWAPIADAKEKSVALGSGYPAGQVRLADFNGDGKVDYLVIGEEIGNVTAWLNIGEIGHVEPKLGGYAAGVRFADLDGDGRDDYISVDGDGKALAYINGGESENGWTWTPALAGTGGLVAIGVGAERHQVHFADLNGDGRDDYVVVDDDAGGVHCYLNGGTDGKGWAWIDKGLVAIGVGRQGGVGVRFADMNGDGRDDYIYLDEHGAATVWINAGDGDTMTNWQVMNNGNVAALGVGANREDVRFADIDGDGLADYIWVHPEDGSVDVWYNNGTLGSALGWHAGGRIAAGAGTPGRNIQFARLGTSGRADYVALDEIDGSARAWVSHCSQVLKTSKGGGSDGTGRVCGNPPLTPPTGPDPERIQYGTSDAENTFDFCNPDLQYNNLDDLIAASSYIRTDCLAINMMQVLDNMFTTTYNNYTDVSNGYDEVFGYYDTYIRKLVPDVLNFGFMFDRNKQVDGRPLANGVGLDFFDCVGGENGNHRYPCKDYNTGDLEGDNYPTTLTLRDADGFWKAVEKAGLSRDWVTFGYQRIVGFYKGQAGGIPQDFVFNGFPIQNTSMTVPNPKTLVDEVRPMLPGLQLELQGTMFDVAMGKWIGGSPLDGPDAYMAPVLMFMQALDSMAQAKQLGQKEKQTEEEAERDRIKNIVLLVLSVVLIFVPFVGEFAAASAGLTTLARSIALLGELSGAAIAIYETVDDPSQALVNILGLLAGIGGIKKAPRNSDGVGSVAKLYRGIGADKLGGLGAVFKTNSEKFAKLAPACRIS